MSGARDRCGRCLHVHGAAGCSAAGCLCPVFVAPEFGRAAVCPHGNRRALGLCPDCDAAAMGARQRRADRARFADQLRRIRGGR